MSGACEYPSFRDDAEPQEGRVLGDEAEQPAETVPLLEMLVDDDARQDAETCRDLGHAVLGRRARRAERDHVARHRRRPGAGAGHDRALAELLERTSGIGFLLHTLGRRDQVPVELDIWPDMIHVWHMFAGRVPESTASVERVGAFLRARP